MCWYYVEKIHVGHSLLGLVVWPEKPWTLEISQECLLCYDQSQQRSRQVNYPQNHKLIPLLLGFFLATQRYRNIYGVHGFPGLTVKGFKLLGLTIFQETWTSIVFLVLRDFMKGISSSSSVEELSLWWHLRSFLPGGQCFAVSYASWEHSPVG